MLLNRLLPFLLSVTRRTPNLYAPVLVLLIRVLKTFCVSLLLISSFYFAYNLFRLVENSGSGCSASITFW
jgi:hypothetical protein